MGRKVWFITDASSALGRSMTEQVLRSGDVAIAALSRPSEILDLVEKYGTNVLLPTKLDAFDRTQVFAALACAKEVFGRIDVVFNNAGGGASDEVETWWEDDEDEESMDTEPEDESWTVANVTWEAVRFFREVNPPKVGGTIVQMSASSQRERSRQALESVTNELARLMDATWNIKLWLVDDESTDAQRLECSSPESIKTASSRGTVDEASARLASRIHAAIGSPSSTPISPSRCTGSIPLYRPDSSCFQYPF